MSDREGEVVHAGRPARWAARYGRGVALVTALAVAPRAGFGQDRDPPAHDPPAAEVLFQRGRTAFEAGNLPEACALFAESYRLDAAVGTLLNQAQCEEQRGQLASAWEHFRTALEQLPANDERQPLAAGRAAALDPRVPRLTLRLGPPRVERTRVVRDRVELREASLGVALPLNPGTHTVELQVPGHEPRVWSFELREGERRELVLTPGQPAGSAAPVTSSVPSAPVPVPAPRGHSTRATVGWAAGSVGAVSLLASLGLGAWALERRSAARSSCPGGQCPTAEAAAAGAQANGEMRALTRVSTGAFVAGLLGLGAGAFLVYTSDF